MSDPGTPAVQPVEPSVHPSLLQRANQKFTYFVGLPIVATIGSFIYSHVDYLTAYQNKVKDVGEQQMKAAEGTYADVSKTFADTITLQQLLFFNYSDAVQSGTDGKDSALETKSARTIYPKYDELRTNLRESIDLLARRVEIDLDWASDATHDAAKAGPIGADQISRIKLGAYNFDCDKDMPSFAPGKSTRSLPVPAKLREDNPNATPLGIDWYSAKHELLTLYFCFDKDHGKIAAARRWAAMSQVDDAAKKEFMKQVEDIKKSFDDEAVRLDTFLTLGARDIEAIRVKFRARSWYCHLIIVRQLFDAFSSNCTPLRTGRADSAS